MAEKGKIDVWTVVVIALIAYAVIPGINTTVNNALGIGKAQEDGATGGVCNVEDVTVTLSSYDMFSKASDITNGSHRVFVNGVDKGYVIEDGSFTASPGDEVMVVFGENSTSHYSVIVEDTLACSGTSEISAGLAAYDVSPSFTVKTEDDQVQSATANAEVMTADTNYQNSVKIKVTSKKSLGNPTSPKGNVLCLQYNSTSFDKIALDGAEKAATPQALTASAGKVANCFYIPVIANDPNDGNDGEWEGQLLSDTASTQPTTHDNVSITVYDTGLDLDGDTLEIIYGVEDEDNNRLGSAKTQSATLYVS